ncbi:3-oxoacyl-[acyl-carrier-protein] synthase III C-terminal domain-containing protein [Paraferrimonas sedimenticola]|uniref:3-oxoacyl-ACP synthase n=1 Tax=Paraferrimonas sedimenticola TaxID=375674 RepID=A0AA37RTN7_9GAMM|nr:3-oxoacyl-[acyl-carrier-protein] synthase III C-terminal domain-containing protein [Paraferrimonas sedimenticola]GLP95104.1 3-oxoacyl-ACP synthase [Paraferrimonas sedimenticola]
MTVKFARHNLNLLGLAHALPGAAVDNKQLLAALKALGLKRQARLASAILPQLGIQNRHLSRSLDKPLSEASPNGIELGQDALTRALTQANIDVSQLGYLISHTTSPHTQVPPNAAWLADAMSHLGPYMELRQACCGFANALQSASAFCAADQQPIAIVGSETGSVYFDINPDFVDRGQLVNYLQMGDGAGAAVVAPATSEQQLLSDIYIGHIGKGMQPGFCLSGGARDYHNGQVARFEHDFNSVRASGPKLFEAGLNAIVSRGYSLEDFRYILPHQANGHIDEQLAGKLGISPNRVINTAKHLGNLGSAAIWVALSQSLQDLPIERGDKVLVLGAEATKYLYGGFVYTH